MTLEDALKDHYMASVSVKEDREHIVTITCTKTDQNHYYWNYQVNDSTISKGWILNINHPPYFFEEYEGKWIPTILGEEYGNNGELTDEDTDKDEDIPAF
jgi:hypothetical protein